jgi:excisionase family DNA binding protein
MGRTDRDSGRSEVVNGRLFFYEGSHVAKRNQGDNGQGDTGSQAETKDELLTLSEVAEMFNVTRQTVSNWVAVKALPSVMTPGGRPKVWRSHVEAIVGFAKSAS